MPASILKQLHLENRRDKHSALRFNLPGRAFSPNQEYFIVKKMEERIASMEQQLKSLKERHQKAEAKRRRDETQLARKNDARRTVLVGTVVLKKVERGEINEAQFRKWLDGTLTGPDDRALFSLDAARKPGAQVGVAGASQIDTTT